MNPRTDGIVLPILHLNGYKISSPTLFSRITSEEVEDFFKGCGWTPRFVEGDEPAQMHQKMAAALDWDRQQKRPVLRVGGRTVPLDEIAYLETAGRKTAVHTREERIEYTVPLSKLKEEFQKQGFCLSHFSYLVNLAHVARVERDALTLDTGEAIPVSRRYYQDFMARYVESLK